MEVKTATRPLRAPHASKQAKKRVTMLAGVIDLENQGEIGLLRHSGGEEVYVWHTDLLGCLVLLPCPVIKVDGKLQQPNSGRTSNDTDPLGMKV